MLPFFIHPIYIYRWAAKQKVYRIVGAYTHITQRYAYIYISIHNHIYEQKNIADINQELDFLPLL